MYLGIDLGTSGVKVVIINDAQQVVASNQKSFDVSRSRMGWSEQNPADWIEATDRALLQLKSLYPWQMQAVRGIGLSGHMHGATVLDKSSKVIRPCILWNDTRSHLEAQQLDSDHRFRETTGNIVFPGFTAPKLLWLRNNEPSNFARIAKVLLPKDYLRLWLSGEFFSDMSDASGTAWLNVGARCWSRELLEATDLNEEHMPQLVEGTDRAGSLRPVLASRWNLPASVIIAGGAGDNAASAAGMGILPPNSAFLSLGTSGVLFASTDAYRPRPELALHTFCHCVAETWHQMGVILSATDSLNWLGSITERSGAELASKLNGDLLPPTGVVFLPYLAGERTPHNDALIRGSFTGLEHSSGPRELTQAVMEGVAFALRDCLEAMRAAGTDISIMTTVGGGGRSEYWLKVVATAFGVPVAIPTAGEFGAAYGAARLGMIAATGAESKSALRAQPIERVIEPDTGLQAAFEDAYERYRSLYPALKRAGRPASGTLPNLLHHDFET